MYASARSNLLVLTTVLNLIILFLFSLVQRRPIFYRPLGNTQNNSQQNPDYAMLVESGHDDDGTENDSTPLAHMNDLKPNSLMDSPEQNSSWFDKLTFLWLTNLLRRGAAKSIDSSDLYNLKPSDVPVHNWKRYQKYRKPGRSLIVTLGLTYAPELLTQFALTMTLCASRFANPFFLQRILRSIEFTQQQRLMIETPRNRYVDVAGLLFFAVLSLVVYNQSLWIGRQIGIRLKGFLVAELTTKTLRRRGKGSSSSEAKGLQGDLAASDGKVMNILTTDFNTVVAVGSYLDNIYNLPVMLVIGIWYMYKMLAFTSIAVFQMVRTAISHLPGFINFGVGGYVALKRIDLYLQQPQAQNLEKRSGSVQTTNNQLGFELSIVAGPTGSGKSSLLSALVGEMTLVRGRVMLPTIDPNALAENNPNYKDVIELSREGLAINDIAYVAQEAWLRNATIRENILFGEPYDRERYEEVLRVCALKPDLRILAAGDMSEVGERGITLSGGQKQRVALARAVYSSRRILLIDDCLSAVDAHTAKHILVECLAGNTKLMQGRTRVLVTHHVAMCLQYAQYSITMNNGRVTLKGTPTELGNNNALSSTLMESLDSKSNSSTAKQNSNDEGQTKNVNDRKSEDEYNKEHLQKLAAKRGIDSDADLSMLQGVLIKEEEREEGYVKLNVWKTFMQACGGAAFWGYLALVLIAGEAITALRSYWIKVWVASVKNPGSGSNVLDSVLSSSTSSDSFVFSSGYAGGIATSSYHSSVYWLGVYTLLGFINVVWSAVMWYSMFTGRLEMARKLHRQLMRAVVHAVPRFHESTPAGRIINRFSRDIAIIDNGALDSIVYWFSGIASVLAVYIIVSMTIPVFAVAAIITISIFVMIALYYLHTSRKLKRLESNSMSPLLSLFGELIQGTTTIRAFNVKHYYIKEAMNRISAHNRSFYGVWSTNMWLGMRVEAVSAVVASTTAIFILFNLNWIDTGMAGFILLYAMSFSDQMFWVIRDYSGNEMNMNAMEHIMQYLNIDQEASLESEPENKPPAVWPTKGDLQIKDLVVEYLPGMPALHGVSLSVKHGERIGVVGRTGAGKSTMSLALLRFLEASKGKIVLDGVDISKIGLEDLRRNVTVIPQDPVLFNGTIRFNLDPFDEHPDELLWEALRRTHLARDNASQPSGADGNNFPASERMAGIFTSLDAEIRENGHNISAGQRQLVTLARAMIRRSRLIIMDEATASVDFDTDSRIQNTIRGPEFANSTLLCIAHRLRTIIDYDKVLVLDDGRAAEFDTPHNLLQDESGMFRSMCEESGEYKAYIQRKGR
ncbi:hypothetical protein IWW48_005649 [Coemansia sp. RSA 1200]|nr:hypothetical protein IWW48_005649 [Coemansia sp. RSA 1200]